MSTYRYISPIDQPTGTFRLIDWLEANFLSKDYNDFKCAVAFAKIKPFIKLHNSIMKWNSQGKTSEAVIGIDHKGTSYQALQYALSSFDSVEILHVEYSTFHPKLYIFQGPNKATAYYGSSNFTSGGLETNFEGGVIIEYSLPSDQTDFDDLMKSYTSLLTATVQCRKKLTPQTLSQIKGLLLDETAKTKRSTSPVRTTASAASIFGGFKVKPVRSIPMDVMIAASKSAGIVMAPVKTSSKKQAKTSPVSPVAKNVIIPTLPEGFVIQVKPQHNGEIYLSKRAIDQCPSFFGFPFNGSTVPKKARNAGYPQRVPDPVANIRVFDRTGALVNVVTKYAVNTIYYIKNQEIRITITPSILGALNIKSITTNYPILVMKESSVIGCDYELDFYEEGSIDYNNYLAICDQTLPSGGKRIARKMGWF